MKIEFAVIRLNNSDVISTSSVSHLTKNHLKIIGVDTNNVTYDCYQYNSDENKWYEIDGQMGIEKDKNNFLPNVSEDDWYCIENNDTYTLCEEEHEECFAKGTKITMADQSLKNIEDIKKGDKVLSFNHEKGEYEGNEVCYTFKGENTDRSFTLKFTSDIELSIVGKHDLFEKESNKYVTIAIEDADKYIGKHFYNATANKFEELLAVEYNDQLVEYYSIYVNNTFNCIANKMLSIPDDCDFLLNIYEFKDNLACDLNLLEKDITKYGLHTYQKDSDVTLEEFNNYNLKYKNIIVAKGLLQLEQISKHKQEIINARN